MSDFEKQVRHALIEKEMSMTDLAMNLGVSISYVYEIIKGTRKAEQMKQRIIQVLEIDDSDNDEQNDSQTNSNIDECV